MQSLPHKYQVQLSGGQVGYTQLKAEGVPDLASAGPKQFDGPGDAWSPEDLLLAAVSSCFLLTLRAVARASGLEFISLDCNCDGVVDKQDRTLRFTQINLRAHLVVRDEADREKALRVLEKSESSCLVSASLSTPVLLDPTVTVAE